MWNRERLIEIIDRDGRRESWLAKQCGVETETIKHYLKGRRNPSRSVIKLMAQALNITEGFLLGEVDSPDERPKQKARVG